MRTVSYLEPNAGMQSRLPVSALFSFKYERVFTFDEVKSFVQDGKNSSHMTQHLGAGMIHMCLQHYHLDARASLTCPLSPK